MKILGLYLGQCSGASIYEENKITFASSEERFTRIKSDETYPLNSINEALKFTKLEPKQLDKVVIGGKFVPLLPMILRNQSSFTVDDHIKSMDQYWKPKLAGQKAPTMLELFKNKIRLDKFPFDGSIPKELEDFEYHQFDESYLKFLEDFMKAKVSEHLKIDQTKIEFLDHHQCHAAYAFWGSPIRDHGTIIATADAHGDGYSATISQYDDNVGKITRLSRTEAKDFQLGRIYRLTTLLLRMLPDEHEYKVMGLAGYYSGPKALEVAEILGKMQQVNGLTFKFDNSIKNIFEYLQENLREFRFDHIASGLQLFTENILTKWFENIVNELMIDKIVYSGGISMNVKANMKIMNIPKIKGFFVCGGGADQSLCMGACYHYAELQGIRSEPLENLYLGSHCNYDSIDLPKYKVENYRSPSQIVDRILDGKVIAVSRGRAEMGPRALCNRTILADPRKRENIDKINHKIKNRDFWMPFAPVIMYEYQDEILVNPKGFESPYMTLGFETIEGKSVIPVGVHQADGTARPMILNRKINPDVYSVLELFYQKTGIPALVNTSFNLHGEPLVNSFQDAICVFENSELDSLWLENHIIDKK